LILHVRAGQRLVLDRRDRQLSFVALLEPAARKERLVGGAVLRVIEVDCDRNAPKNQMWSFQNGPPSVAS